MAQIAARGVGSIRLVKVKSHTTREQLEQGLITPERRIGNEHADQLAVLGRLLAGDWVDAINWVLQARKAYQAFVARVQAMRVCIIQATTRLRADPLLKAKMANAKQVIACLPGMPDTLEYQALRRWQIHLGGTGVKSTAFAK
eukprot:5975177-Alexandrium_andersonii.AAC.1